MTAAIGGVDVMINMDVEAIEVVGLFPQDREEEVLVVVVLEEEDSVVLAGAALEEEALVGAGSYLRPEGHQESGC